jgi:hypothetical protein
MNTFLPLISPDLDIPLVSENSFMSLTVEINSELAAELDLFSFLDSGMFAQSVSGLTTKIFYHVFSGKMARK